MSNFKIKGIIIFSCLIPILIYIVKLSREKIYISVDNISENSSIVNEEYIKQKRMSCIYDIRLPYNEISSGCTVLYYANMRIKELRTTIRLSRTMFLEKIFQWRENESPSVELSFAYGKTGHVQIGYFRKWHANGNLAEEGTLNDHGCRVGEYKVWHSNGKIARNWQYSNDGDVMPIDWVEYDENGKVIGSKSRGTLVLVKHNIGHSMYWDRNTDTIKRCEH